MFEEKSVEDTNLAADAATKAKLKVAIRICYGLGLLGLGVAIALSFFGGVIALRGWVFGGLIGFLALALGYGLSWSLAPRVLDDAELPPELVQQLARKRFQARLGFAVAVCLAPLSLVLATMGDAGLALGVVGGSLSFAAFVIGLALAWERASLRRRYSRFSAGDYLAHWTCSDGSEVYIGRDAACCDGAMITWDGVCNVLADVVWLEGETAAIEFHLQRYHPEAGLIGEEVLRMPVPADCEDEARHAIAAVRQAPAKIWAVLLNLFCVVAGLVLLIAQVTQWLGLWR